MFILYNSLHLVVFVFSWIQARKEMQLKQIPWRRQTVLQAKNNSDFFFWNYCPQLFSCFFAASDGVILHSVVEKIGYFFLVSKKWSILLHIIASNGTKIIIDEACPVLGSLFVMTSRSSLGFFGASPSLEILVFAWTTIPMDDCWDVAFRYKCSNYVYAVHVIWVNISLFVVPGFCWSVQSSCLCHKTFYPFHPPQSILSNVSQQNAKKGEQLRQWTWELVVFAHPMPRGQHFSILLRLGPSQPCLRAARW